MTSNHLQAVFKSGTKTNQRWWWVGRWGACIYCETLAKAKRSCHFNTFKFLVCVNEHATYVEKCFFSFSTKYQKDYVEAVKC